MWKYELQGFHLLHQNSHRTLVHQHIKLFFAVIYSVLLFLYSVAWYSCQSCLDRQFVCPPWAIPFCHVWSYALCFPSPFWCNFSCVMFLWIMLHFISHIYCILCWDSPSSPLWVWFIGSLWDLAVSLSINYILLYVEPQNKTDTHTHTHTCNPYARIGTSPLCLWWS